MSGQGIALDGFSESQCQAWQVSIDAQVSHALRSIQFSHEFVIAYEDSMADIRVGQPLDMAAILSTCDISINAARELFAEPDELGFMWDVPYYIGITVDPYERMTNPQIGHLTRKGWTHMRVLANGDADDMVAIERALIAAHIACDECKNLGPGGERRAPRGTAMFVYVVTGKRLGT